MKVTNPYTGAGEWYRGSLHIHSTYSVCGWHNCKELALMYNDYDFLAITDHNRVTTETKELEDKVLFRGLEVSHQRHMLLVNTTPPVEEDFDFSFTIENFGRLAKETVAQGGLAIASHPMREHGQHWSVDELLQTAGLTGMEVFSGDGIHVEEDVGFELWDKVLSGGRRLWGVGNDDFHHLGQERRVWDVVCAKDKTHDAILRAFTEGNFYISTGFGFDSITTQGNTIEYKLLSSTELHRNAYKYMTLYGKDGRVLAEKTGRFTEFTYSIQGDEGYVRAEAYMTGGYGAFTQPIFIDE